MARWEPGAGGRLQEAAMELFAERGYEQTTVDDIAAHAGVTRRTFFRHYRDKREALFGASSEGFERFVVESLDAVPADTAPLDAVAEALRVICASFDGRHVHAARRQGVIAAHPELQERELAKLTRVAASLAGRLRDRGTGEPEATMAAEAGMLAFRHAFEAWTAQDPEAEPLTASFDRSLRTLRSLA